MTSQSLTDPFDGKHGGDHQHSGSSPSDDSKQGEYWERIRGVIVHEDNLVNHRLTWLITVEGFLIGGFVFVQPALTAAKPPITVVLAVESLFSIIFIGGIWISYITGVNISAAFAQVAAASNSWYKKYPNEKANGVRYYPRWIRPRVETVKADAVSASPGVLNVYPPVAGAFEYRKLKRLARYFGSSTKIPLIMMFINACGLIASIVMSITICARVAPKSKTTVVIQRESTGLITSLTIESDGVDKGVVKELESITQACRVPPTTLPAIK